jgi:hypothetical protein
LSLFLFVSGGSGSLIKLGLARPNSRFVGLFLREVGKVARRRVEWGVVCCPCWLGLFGFALTILCRRRLRGTSGIGRFIKSILWNYSL